MKNKLAKKLLLTILIMSILLINVTGILVSSYYKDIRLKQVKEQSISYARFFAQNIDGDKTRKIIETGEVDDYYMEIHKRLKSFQTEADNVLYAFVAVPREDDFLYIWGTELTEEEVKDYAFDATDKYDEAGKETANRVFRKDSKGSFDFYHYDNEYLGEALYPICDSDGNPVAISAIDVSATNLEKEQMHFVMVVVLAVASIFLIAFIILYLVIKKRMVQPIEKIDNATRSFVKNIESSETLKLDIYTNDEIEELSNSFEQMSREVKKYISELESVTAEKERIGAELDIAAHIQKSMLPCIFPAFPERHEFDIYATMTPAKEVGGDFYDFFMVDDRHVAIVAADVSGKGVPASLFMVIAKTLIKDHTTPETDLGRVFTIVNDLLCESNGEELFVTAFLGVLDLLTGEFRFVNAGHEIPFICRKGETFKPHPIKAGFVLAGMENINYKSGVLKLEPGDKIFEYTDGVTEATDINNELFGMGRLEESLGKYSDKPIQELLHLVKEDIDEFVGEAPQFDDITMICLEYKTTLSIVYYKE